jgi:NADH-quinone oxidoreductase subunit E
MTDAAPSATHVVEVCGCSCCDGQVSGEQLFHDLCVLAGVDPEAGGASADGTVKLERAECLDACGTGPVLRVDGERIFKELSPAEAARLVEELRRKP